MSRVPSLLMLSKYLILSLPFHSFSMMCFRVDLFEFILHGINCFPDVCNYFYHQILEVFSYYFFKYPLLLSFFFWDSHEGYVGLFNDIAQVA